MFKPVITYIYHRPPMLLVDTIVGADPMSVFTTTSICEDNLFVDKQKNYLPSWVGMEIMAQTAGVWVGMEDERGGQKPSLGFLLGARSFEAFIPGFTVGDVITTVVKVTFAQSSTVVFEGEIKNASGCTLAKGELTAFRPDDPDAYLRGDKT